MKNEQQKTKNKNLTKSRNKAMKSTGDSYINLIRASFPTDLSSTTTNQLYSNGKHQLQVDIEIQKQMEDENYQIIDMPLTETEKASVTILSAGAASLPEGWSCTAKREEQYDLGLINQTMSKSAAKSNASISTSNDIVVRYLSVGANSNTSENLMVQVTLEDGTVHTTFENNTNYKQDLKVNTQRPVTCLPEDMDLTSTQVFFHDWGSSYQRTYEDKWEMKAGLRQTSYFSNGPNDKVFTFNLCGKDKYKNSFAVCAPYDDIELVKTTNKRLAGCTHKDGTEVYISKHDTNITCYRTFYKNNGNGVMDIHLTGVPIRIVDNFGTTHDYIFSGGDATATNTPCRLTKG
jgi:hypothetical protein